MRKIGKNIIWAVGVVLVGGFTIGVTYRILAEPDGSKASGQWVTSGSVKHEIGEGENGGRSLLQRGMVRVEDQSGRPGVRSTDFTATVDGVDKDANGVRDDIQSYINRNYQNPMQRQAMLQYASAAQQYLLHSESYEDVKQNWVGYSKSLECLTRVFGIDKWRRESAEIKAQMLNTSIRMESYIHMQRASVGHLYNLYSGDSPCDN